MAKAKEKVVEETLTKEPIVQQEDPAKEPKTSPEEDPAKEPKEEPSENTKTPKTRYFVGTKEVTPKEIKSMAKTNEGCAELAKQL